MKKNYLLGLIFFASVGYAQNYIQSKGGTTYCMPKFSWDGADNFKIDSVTFSNLIGTKVGSGFDYPAESAMTVTPPAKPQSYTVLYTKDTAKVEAGQTYVLAVSRADNPPPMIRYAWFDWNQNGSFADAGEEYAVANQTNQLVDKTAKANILIPANANGLVRMRIRMLYDGVGGGLAGKSCDSIHFAGGGCGETEDYLVKVNNAAVQINELISSTVISIYPNPTNGISTIQLEPGSVNRILEIYSVSGMLVKSHTLEKNQTHVTIDMTDLSNGVYILSVQNNFSLTKFKFIKY